MGNAIPADDAAAKKTLDHALQTWVAPEIERRKAEGRLPADFILSAAQIIFNMEGPSPVVRLNSEIKAVMLVRAARAIKAGEIIGPRDFSEIVEMRLTEHDPDAAHLTFAYVEGGKWYLSFDFRYNARKTARLLDTARQFLDCAQYAMSKGHARAVADNLFSATELMAKGILAMLPDPKIMNSKKHGHIAALFNQWGKLGNVDPKYVDLLNWLSEIRISARYLRSAEFAPFGMPQRLALAEEMYRDACERVPKRSSTKIRES